MASMTRHEALEANGGDGALLDWTARFGTEEACEAELLRRMWPEGFRCPSCGGDRCSRVRGRAHKWQCTRCSRQFSVTAGTAMRGTKLPLVKWFLAVYLDRVANCGVRETRHRNGLRPRISFDQEKDSRERRPQWTLYSKTRSR